MKIKPPQTQDVCGGFFCAREQGLLLSEGVWGNCAGTCATDYDDDELDRLTDVEYLSNPLDVEGFVMEYLGNRDGAISRCDAMKRVNCTAQSLVAGKNEGRKKYRTP